VAEELYAKLFTEGTEGQCLSVRQETWRKGSEAKWGGACKSAKNKRKNTFQGVNGRGLKSEKDATGLSSLGKEGSWKCKFGLGGGKGKKEG